VIDAGQQVEQLRLGAGPDDGGTHTRMRERERQGDAQQRNPGIGGHPLERLEHVELALHLVTRTIPPRLREERARRSGAFVGRGVAAVLARQPAAVERAIAEDADAVALARREQSPFDGSCEDGIRGLLAHRRDVTTGARQARQFDLLPRRRTRRADHPDLARPHQVGQGAE
jgi:hypothetical protein